MPANKNQHYVPRCHLRPFSLDGAGAAINLYNHPTDCCIKAAPIRGQCSRDYFYGKDLRLENILKGAEGRYATILRQLEAYPSCVTEDDKGHLREFAFLQLSRTEGAVKRRVKALQSMDEISHRGKEHFRREKIDISHDHMVMMGMKTFAESAKVISDLDVVLLVNETKTPFITSDDPAVLMNRLYQQRRGGQSFGLISAGVQIAMPLSPGLALMCFDGAAYATPTRRGDLISLTRSSDVSALNELQYLSCSSNIYFSHWEQRKTVQAEFQKSKARRPAEWFRHWVGIQTAKDSRGEHYRRATEEEILNKEPKIISISPVYPSPSAWITPLEYRVKVYGFTMGSAMGHIREAQTALYPLKRFWREELKHMERRYPDGPATAFLTNAGGVGEG